MPRTVLVAPVPNRDITAAAREELRGRWIHFNLLVLGLLVINILLQLVVNHLPWMLGLSVILSCGIQIGVCRFFLNRVRGAETDDLSALKLGFIRFGNVVVTTLLAILWILLKLLLLIVPGILAALDYAMVKFILADDPLYPPGEVLKRSKAMMYGHRWQLVRLWFRFLGWGVLCIFTLGIGLFWLIPYINTALARFYDTIRPFEPVAEPPPVVGTPPPYCGYSSKTSIIVAVAILLLFSLNVFWVGFCKIEECRKRMTFAAVISIFSAEKSFPGGEMDSCPYSGRKYISGREFIDFWDRKSLSRKILMLELPDSHLLGAFNVAPAEGQAKTFRLEDPSCESFIALLKQHYDLAPGFEARIRKSYQEKH